MNSLIELEKVNLSYQGRHVIQDVSFHLDPDQITTLIGPNGSGKTTLARMVLGLVKPESGRIIRRPDLRIGYMPQKLHLESTMPITVARFMQLPKKHPRENLKAALAEVGVEYLLDSPIQKLSGGETQRVMLARALLRRPQLLVLDEPAQGVDITGQIELYQLITDIKKRHNCTVLMVSHDLHLVMASTDHVICLNNHVCCSGHPERVSTDPAFISLFGQQGADTLALYSHHHNHLHDAHGEVIQNQPCDHEHHNHHHG